ncbi:MAG: glycerate kinase [Clostridia bacterium]
MSENQSKKIVICPDSFKGTLSSIAAAETIAEAIKYSMPEANLVVLPIADGGEGTIDCFKRGAEGREVSVQTRNSNFKTITASYLLSNHSAIIESARVVGLSLTEEKNPSRTTTYGIGQLIADALRRTKKVILALGGSSTNDGGCGIAVALGAKFYSKRGNEFVPTGGSLIDIERIDISGLPKIDMTCMCDVKNTMYGQNGAAYVYARQKGADDAMIEKLDIGLRHLSKKIEESTGKNVADVIGGGAAGAIAAGMVAFFDAKLKSGISVMLDAVDFNKIIDGADLIITGEGRLDSQSLQGKALDGILQRATDKGVPVIAVCGQVESNLDIKKAGLQFAVATSDNADLILSYRDYKMELYITVRKLFDKLYK